MIPDAWILSSESTQVHSRLRKRGKTSAVSDAARVGGLEGQGRGTVDAVHYVVAPSGQIEEPRFVLADGCNPGRLPLAKLVVHSSSPCGG